jgi:hypothetical protein
MAFISQYASNQKLKIVLRLFKKWIRFDYLTTLLLAVWPIILAYQSQIIAFSPPALTVVVTGLFGFVSQWVAEKRNENADSEDSV